MNNDPRNILPGDRVVVFDPRLYVDDVRTPLSYTMRPAIVMRRYGMKIVDRSHIEYSDNGRMYGEPVAWVYPDLVDVLFYHMPDKISCGHFTNSVEVM
jgi:signal peptidase I